MITGRPAKSKDMVEGRVFKTEFHGDVVVLNYISSKEVEIKFLDSGTIRVARADHIREGCVKDNATKKKSGYGYFGEGPYNSVKDKRAYGVWNHMLSRCYDPKDAKYPRYGGRGVTVCDDWHDFNKFTEWYYENYKEGSCLDKDLTVLGSKIYSPETCCFIPARVNGLLISRVAARGDYPLGVMLNYGRLIASCHDDKKKLRFLGYHNTEEDAFAAYKAFKEKTIKIVAKEEYDKGTISKVIYENLMGYEVVPYPE